MNLDCKQTGAVVEETWIANALLHIIMKLHFIRIIMLGCVSYPIKLEYARLENLFS